MQKRDFETYQKRFRDFEILPKFSETHVFRGTIRHPYSCSSIHMLQTTTKRPPSLTLTGARIFKQRLATIRKHGIGSQEPGPRTQEPDSSEQM